MTKGTSKKPTAKPVAAIRKASETQANFSKVTTPAFKKENFREISIDAPCKIFIDKKSSAIYITTNEVSIAGKKANR